MEKEKYTNTAIYKFKGHDICSTLLLRSVSMRQNEGSVVLRSVPKISINFNTISQEIISAFNLFQLLCINLILVT